MNLVGLLIPFFAVAIFLNTAYADNRVIAKINGKPVTAFELNEEFQELLPMAGSYHGGVSREKMASIREKALNNLIEKELHYQDAVGKNIPVSTDEVDSELLRMEKRFETSKKFKEAIKNSGITTKELKQFVKKRLLISKIREQEVTAKAILSDEELRDYYEKNRPSFKKPEEFRASHILIGVDPASTKEEWESKLKKAKDILVKIKAGEDFGELAMKYSTDQGSAPIGGDIGTFHRGMAEIAFENAIISLKVGEVSDIVETLYGYHIIKLTGIKPETQLKFDDVKLEIKQNLEKKRSDELYKNWTEGLRAKASIEILK